MLNKPLKYLHMKRLNYWMLALLIVSVPALFVSCTGDDDDDDQPDNTPFIATQADLDAATKVFEKGITGKPYGDATIAHNGSSMPADSTFRDVFSNLSDNADPLAKGTIITKHTYVMDENGNQSDLQVTFAMVKREDGYYTDGGDWEYSMMPFDASVDYNSNPNGMLPTSVDDQSRGKLGMCAGCHAAGGSDYLFVR